MPAFAQLRIRILADDLTSAADGAGPFVERGLSAVVGRGVVPVQAADVLAVDSGSRSATVQQAAAQVGRLTAQLSACDILYKTCDSTLRGHIRVELEAAFAASGRRRMVFAPAFPDGGRTTVDGVQLVDGVPVADSPYGNDPVHPVRYSRLAEYVPAGDVVLLDAESQNELDHQVAAISDPYEVLWAGSPGMAMALARRFAPNPKAQAELPISQGEIVIAVGSANSRSHRQADRLHAEAGLHVMRAPAERCDDPRHVLAQLVASAVQRLRGGRVGALIATGGDTMEAILDSEAIVEFAIAGELEAGFPLGVARRLNGMSLLLAMKAGGFGDDETLVRAVARLRGPNKPNETAAP